MNYSLLLLALLSLGFTQAVVQFSKSALYDIYDFVGVDEVRLPLCDSGCYIYASTIGKGTNPITRVDLYADSLVISQDGGRTGQSIARLALEFDDSTKKIPFIITAGSKWSVINQNIESDRFNSIVVYVVDAQVAKSTDFEIYDSVNMNMAIAVPANVTTIMSAVPFTFTAKGDKGVKNSVTTRLVGFDNAFDSNGDECPIAFQTSTTPNSFPGFLTSAPVPIVSLTFSEANRVQVTANHQFYNNIEYYDDGFITSAGWNGCRKPNSGGYQSFRSPNYITSNSYMIMTNDDYFSVHLEAEMHLDEQHPLLVRDLTNWNDVNWFGTFESGTALKTLDIQKTYFCEFKSREMEGDQGFIVKHYGKMFIDDGKTTTTSLPKTTTQSTVESGPYCQCDMDRFGMPLNWASTDIWLDIVIVLDTSEALSAKSLQDAATFIESMFGNDDGDVLTTDPKAPHYTRVGVIAMSDEPQVLYNLNMTKSDTVGDRVSIRKGVSEMDLTKAFTAAQSMLSNGLVSEPKRSSTRQVVHFMTNSQTNADSAALTKFKSSGGVVIVNNVLKSGEQPKSSLKSIASEGFFYSDVSDYMDNVQALCKANCFCAGDLVPYNGGVQDPALQAAGGCYSASAAGVSFSKAKQTCASSRAGIIATDHDGSKGAFLNQLISDAVPRTYFFWIGYSKWSDGNWRWEDESSDAYTNWAKDEPSSSPVAKCAYVDQSSSSLSWGAGNCNTGFPYACEYTPCSAGNSNC